MNLRNEEACFGVIDGFEVLKLGQKEDNIVRELNTFLLSYSLCGDALDKMNIDYLRVAEQIMCETFLLHKIPYCPSSTLKILEQQAKWDYPEYTHIIELLDKITTYINPYNLTITPVSKKKIPGINGYLVNSKTHGCRHVYTNIDMPQLYNFKKCIICNHEIMHSQIRGYGSITNMQNSELLCFFIEFITALKLDPSCHVFRALLHQHFTDLRNNLEFLKKHPALTSLDTLISVSAYVISEIKNARLFNLYYNGNTEIKDKIISLLQMVIDGNKSIEDVLQELDITYENSATPDTLKRMLI